MAQKCCVLIGKWSRGFQNVLFLTRCSPVDRWKGYCEDLCVDIDLCMMTTGKELNKNIGSKSLHHFVQTSEVARAICGQGHVSNFYIVDLENFARASRRYTGDYTQLDRHRFVYDTCNTMKATRTRHGSVHVFITRRPNQLHNFDLFRTCRISIVSALLRGNWQDFN